MAIRHFIVGGAQRSATTYMVRALSAHPEIQMAEPARPEPKFFLKPDCYDQGVSAYHDQFFPTLKSDSVRIYGEKSTSYIESVDAAKAIKTFLPDAKLIFALRNPIDRAISNISFSRMHGYEDAPLETAILRELDDPDSISSAEASNISVSPQAYLQRGRYVEHLKPYRDLFGRDQIHLTLTENFVGSLSHVQDIYKYLNVDPHYVPEMLDQRINISKKTGDDDVSSEIRARLLAHFRSSNDALAQLFGLDLSPWT